MPIADTVALYLMENNPDDVLGNYGASNPNGVPFSSSIVKDGSYSCGRFSATNYRLITPSISESIRTFEFWFYWPTGHRVANEHAWGFDINNRLLVIGSGTAITAGGTRSATVPLTDDQWENIAVTWNDGGQCRLFVNNVEGATVATATVVSGGVHEIGNLMGFNLACDGYIDSFRFSDVLRTVFPTPLISITGITPVSGPVGGGTSVEVRGSDFDGSEDIFFGSRRATNILFVDSTRLTCDTPAHPNSSVNVKVQFSLAYLATLTAGFAYTDDVRIRARLMGVDLTQFVTSYGRLEQIKDILLAQATLLTTEMTIQVVNFQDFAKPKGVGSLFGGLNWYNQVLEILRDGRTIYEGFVKNIRTSPNEETADIVSENVLKKPAETVIVASALSANPAQAMLGFLRLVLEDSSINVTTFNQAGAQATNAGATIDYVFAQGDNVTVLQAIQLVSDLASISVFVKDNKVIARPFIPYQGDEAGLKFELNDSIVREWGELEFDNSAFNNKVAVGYPTDQFEILTDVESIKTNGITREIQFPADAKVAASDLTSARFFARLYIRRAAKRRQKLNIAGGEALKGTVIGDRFPVTSPDLGLVRSPMECIEVHQTLDGNEMELALAQIFEN